MDWNRRSIRRKNRMFNVEWGRERFFIGISNHRNNVDPSVTRGRSRRRFGSHRIPGLGACANYSNPRVVGAGKRLAQHFVFLHRRRRHRRLRRRSNRIMDRVRPSVLTGADSWRPRTDDDSRAAGGLFPRISQTHRFSSPGVDQSDAPGQIQSGRKIDVSIFVQSVRNPDDSGRQLEFT